MQEYFWGQFRSLPFQILTDIVPVTNDAVRGTYLQFTRNVTLAQLQRPIGYRFDRRYGNVPLLYTSYTLPYTRRQLSATGAVDDGHCMQYARSYPNFHTKRAAGISKKETPMLKFSACPIRSVCTKAKLMTHFAAYHIICSTYAHIYTLQVEYYLTVDYQNVTTNSYYSLLIASLFTLTLTSLIQLRSTEN